MLTNLLRSFPRMVLDAIRGNSVDGSRSVDQSDIRRLLYFYLAALLAYLFVVQLAIPIFMTDTDMWYHLNGGRYFWTTGQVPNFSYFSFLEPVREWTNYFWGFQAVIYQIFDFSGYQGLLVFRALMHVLTVGLILVFIFTERKAREQPMLFIVLVAVLVVIVFARSYAVRPHMVSYLCIILTVYILQYRPRLAPLLPLVTVLWSNLHGIELVVNALICGAYLIEHVYTRWQRELPFWGMDRRYVFSILACSVAWLMTPHGVALVGAPFAFDDDIFLFIHELSAVRPSELYTFLFSFVELNESTSVTVLATMEVVGAVMLVLRRKLRISHAVMAIGGAYLLSKGLRFVWEWTYLSLPLIHAALVESLSSDKGNSRIPVWRILVTMYFVAMPFLKFAEHFGKYSDYPFQQDGLPINTVMFLRENDAKGNLLADPNSSGYFQWALYPDMLIHSDMEFPPFKAIDLYVASWAELDANVFARLLKRDKIDFVAIHLQRDTFKGVVSNFKQFVPVFFGDTHILYANKTTQSELANRYKLEFVDPYNLKAGAGTVEQRMKELSRIAETKPDGRRVNHAFVWLLINEERYEEALAYADRFVDIYPDNPNSQYLKGNVLEGLNRCEEAIVFYKNALEHADESFANTVKKQLGSCAYILKRFDEAYSWFSQSMNPYKRAENSKVLYQYAFSAAAVGELKKARNILDILLWSADPEDKDLISQVKSFRDDISDDELSNIGIISWLTSLFD